MTALVWLIPAALLLGALGLAAFLWSMRTGQYDDLDGAAWRALDDDIIAASPKREGSTGQAPQSPIASLGVRP